MCPRHHPQTGTATPLPCSASAPRVRRATRGLLLAPLSRTVAFEPPGRLACLAPVTCRRLTVLPRLGAVVVQPVTLVGGVTLRGHGRTREAPASPQFPDTQLCASDFRGQNLEAPPLPAAKWPFPVRLRLRLHLPASPFRAFVVELFAARAFHAVRRALSSARSGVSPPPELPTPARVERTCRGSFGTPSLLRAELWSEPRGGICVVTRACFHTRADAHPLRPPRLLPPAREESVPVAHAPSRAQSHGIEAGDWSLL